MRRHAEDTLDSPPKIDPRRPRLDQNISILSKLPLRLGKIVGLNLLERQDETIGSDDPDQWRSPNLHRLDGITDLVHTSQPDIGQPRRQSCLVQHFQHTVPPSNRLQTLTSHCNSHTSPTPFYLNGFIAAQARSNFPGPLEAKIEQTQVVVEALEAYLSKGEVSLREPGKLLDLREKAFGTLTGDKISLNPYETFYLVEKKRINVLDEKTKQTRSLQQLVTKLSVGKPAIWTKYLVYRDLRDRGYLVREGEAGYDFESFGKGAMRRLVSIVFEGGESTLEKLATLSAKANKDGKDLVLAVIDRRTDIVYYTLNPETFQGQ